jgi:hypothetical protein
MAMRLVVQSGIGGSSPHEAVPAEFALAVPARLEGEKLDPIEAESVLL